MTSFHNRYHIFYAFENLERLIKLLLFFDIRTWPIGIFWFWFLSKLQSVACLMHVNGSISLEYNNSIGRSAKHIFVN